MTDAEWIATLDKVTDPVEALGIVLENEDYFGFDPYYRDIRGAVLGMAQRVYNAAKEKS